MSVRYQGSVTNSFELLVNLIIKMEKFLSKTHFTIEMCCQSATVRPIDKKFKTPKSELFTSKIIDLMVVMSLGFSISCLLLFNNVIAASLVAQFSISCNARLDGT